MIGFLGSFVGLDLAFERRLGNLQFAFLLEVLIVFHQKANALSSCTVKSFFAFPKRANSSIAGDSASFNSIIDHVAIALVSFLSLFSFTSFSFSMRDRSLGISALKLLSTNASALLCIVL